ncbi:MAG: PEP-utilizing enzyme [bacterium]
MNKSVITQYQPSITEWFAAIGEKQDSEAFRKEDNGKVDRLEFLYQTIGLPYERPEKWEARELTDKTPAFTKVLKERGDELCAIRLVPKKEGLPKIRNRGQSIRECYENWYVKQDINPDDYFAFICPHTPDLVWSAIFVVNQEAIFGEIIRGMAAQLTHGDTTEKLIQFRYDFQDWQWSEPDPEAEQQIKKIIELIKVTDPVKQKAITDELGISFSHDYLASYFEITVWPGDKIYYIDINRFLGPRIPTPPPFVNLESDNSALVTGSVAQSGKAIGRVVIVKAEEINQVDFQEGDILVCDNTDVRFLPLMKKAGAIVTDRGGILSHAAITSREMNKPGIIGTGNGTQILKTGDQVEVDATRGIVRKI